MDCHSILRSFSKESLQRPSVGLWFHISAEVGNRCFFCLTEGVTDIQEWVRGSMYGSRPQPLIRMAWPPYVTTTDTQGLRVHGDRRREGWWVEEKGVGQEVTHSFPAYFLWLLPVMWPCLTLGYREVKSYVYPNVEISRYWWTRVSLPHCIGQSMWLGEEAEFRVTHVHTTGDKLAMDQEAERSRREFAWTQPLPPAPGTAKDFLAGLFGSAENPARLGCLQAEDSFCLWQGISPHSINKSHMGFRPCGCMLACLTFFCSMAVPPVTFRSQTISGGHIFQRMENDLLA